MKINSTNQLNEIQKKQVESLQEQTLIHDKTANKIWLSNEINYDKNLPCFFLAYEGDFLVGFLSIFMPSKYLPEISAFVCPDNRRKGIFSELLYHALTTLKKENIEELLFVVNDASADGLTALNSYKAVLSHTENCMICNNFPPKSQNTLTFVRCDKNNAKLFNFIERSVFSETEDGENFVDALIKDDNRQGFICYKDGVAVGVFTEYFGESSDETFLYGVGILEGYRGLGYGKALLNYALRLGLSRSSKVILDVATTNEKALSIYYGAGFELSFSVSYYLWKF